MQRLVRLSLKLFLALGLILITGHKAHAQYYVYPQPGGYTYYQYQYTYPVYIQPIQFVQPIQIIQVPDYYASTVFSRSTCNIGGAWNYTTALGAQLAATVKCGEADCTVVQNVRNGCAAIAYSVNADGECTGGYGTGYAASRQAARDEALTACLGKNLRCKAHNGYCTN